MPASEAISPQNLPSCCFTHVWHQQGSPFWVCSGGGTPPEQVPVGGVTCVEVGLSLVVPEVPVVVGTSDEGPFPVMETQ